MDQVSTQFGLGIPIRILNVSFDKSTLLVLCVSTCICISVGLKGEERVMEGEKWANIDIRKT